MQRYRRPLGDGPLKYRGKRYAGGTVVEMAAAHAAPLLGRGRLAPEGSAQKAEGGDQPSGRPPEGLPERVGPPTPRAKARRKPSSRASKRS